MFVYFLRGLYIVFLLLTALLLIEFGDEYYDRLSSNNNKNLPLKDNELPYCIIILFIFLCLWIFIIVK